MNWNDPDEVAAERERLQNIVNLAEKQYQKAIHKSIRLHRIAKTFAIISLIMALIAFTCSLLSVMLK